MITVGEGLDPPVNFRKRNHCHCEPRQGRGNPFSYWKAGQGMRIPTVALLPRNDNKVGIEISILHYKAKNPGCRSIPDF